MTRPLRPTCPCVDSANVQRWVQKPCNWLVHSCGQAGCAQVTPSGCAAGSAADLVDFEHHSMYPASCHATHLACAATVLLDTSAVRGRIQSMPTNSCLFSFIKVPLWKNNIHSNALSATHLTSLLKMLRSECAASSLLVCLQRSLLHQGSCKSLACMASASVSAAAAASTLGVSCWW